MTGLGCSFSLDGVDEIAAIVADRLSERAAFSLIRLGDGEGMLMSVTSASPPADFEYLAKHLGPDGARLERVMALKARLIDAVGAADVVGVRDDIVDVSFDVSSFELPEEEFLVRFRRAFKLRRVEADLPYRGCRRIALLHRALTELRLPRDRRFCSAWVSYELHRSGALLRLLRRERRIGVISSRRALPATLERLLGLSVKYVEIPDMYRSLEAPIEGAEYVGRLEQVLSERLTEFPGMLFLIAGGLYGKLYCQAVKSQGGVALDVGALVDAWLGIPSRPTVYRSMSRDGQDGSAVPAELLLTAANVDRRSGR